MFGIALFGGVVGGTKIPDGVDREGSLALPSWLAEAWLVKEASAILQASVFSCMSNSLMRANLHAWRITLSHKSTTCVRCTDRSNAQQNGQLSIRRASDRSFAAVASQRQSLTAFTYRETSQQLNLRPIALKSN